MLKLPRMENKSSLSTRQHAIADLGADILKASGKMANHGSFQCIIDMAFLCISSAKGKQNCIIQVTHNLKKR